MQVSNAQHQAITHGAGPAIVLAGPGSGKTLVITQRVRYLIEAYHVRPQEILVITFTKAAAQEMQSRFQALSRQRGVTFGTFHAVFFHILKYAYHYSAANILTEEKKYQILQRLLSESGLHFEDEKETLSEIASEISVVKNEQIPLEHYYSKSCPEEVFRGFYRKYEEMHRRDGLLDFDDMMTMTYELLTQRTDILAAWQRHYRYILVDEFQDINLLQYAILRLLADPERNLFIVGDDDQSIYRFRGAKPEIMLNFPKDYPDAKQIVLDRNFRSVASVIRAAQLVIRENTKRFAKRAVHVRKGQGQIDIREFSGQEHESLYLIKKVQESLAGGIPPNEIAVLYRTNQGARPYAERLMEFNIPFEMRDALPNIYEHWIAKDLFAYLHLARERLDRAEFLQVMNRPKRYIARDAIDAKVISLETLRTYYEDKDWMLDRIDRLELDLRMLKQVVFWSEKYARRAKTEWKAALVKARDLSAHPDSYTRATSYVAAKYVKKIDYDKQTGEILTASSVLDINDDLIKEEEALNGYYILLTSEMEESDERIIDIYRGFWRIEKSFWITKKRTGSKTCICVEKGTH